MKANLTFSAVCILSAALCARGQVTFIYDQQSATNEGQPDYGAGAGIQGLLPSTGQSFTPGLPGIDFIRLIFDDANPDDGAGATIYLNLRSDSITGPILGSTAPVSMINGFRGTRNFFFPSTISLTPQTTYYFDLVFVSGGPWNTIIEPHTYFGGEAFVQGQPYPGGDYWFREGIYTIPEPSTAALGLLAMAAFALRRSMHSKSRSNLIGMGHGSRSVEEDKLFQVH